MRQVYTSQDVSQVGYYKSILDEAGIVSYIRNENTANPEVCGAEYYPALCVTDDQDYDEAVKVLQSVQTAKPSTGPDWTCAHCQEQNPSNFDSCWSCETLRQNP